MANPCATVAFEHYYRVLVAHKQEKCLWLTEDEFFEHKDAIVEEVLSKLRGLAKLEAELLFRESELYGESLPEVSQAISNAINAATDALSAALDTLSGQDQEQLLPLFRAHLPKTLAGRLEV